MLPIRTINEIFRTIPSTKLASLVKGEVLSPERIRATTGGIVTPPTFFKTALSLAPHHVLASLVKGRWIDGKAQALILLLSVYDTSAFFYLSNFSAVKTEGLSLHQPFQNRTIPPTFRRASVCVCLYGFVSALSLAQHHVLASLVKGEVLSPEKIRATTGGIAPYPHQSLLFPLIFAKEHLSLALLAPPVAPNTAIPRNHCKRTIIPRKSPSVLI